MVKVKGVEARLIIADSYTELLKAVGNEVANYEGFSPDVVFRSDTEAIIYHDEIEETHAGTGRYCCECDHYEWGKGCPYKNGHITLKMDACDHFNIYL